MATGDAWRSLAAGSVTEASREDPRGMSGEEVMVVTTVTAPEAGRDGEQLAGLGCWARGEHGVGGPQESRKQWKKFLYCEPHKRIKEVQEEELHIKRDECHIKNPPAGNLGDK